MISRIMWRFGEVLRSLNKTSKRISEAFGRQIDDHRLRLWVSSGVATLLVLTSVYAFYDGDKLAAFEITVFGAINTLPVWLQPLTVFITNVGTVGAVALAGLVALLSKHRRIGLAVLISGGTAWLVSHVLKDMIGRARPNEFIMDAIIRYDSLAVGNGFPSGHATVAAAVAMSLAMVLPRRWVPFLIIAAFLVGLSRVYLGVHLPLDVVGGWCIGIIVGYGTHLALVVEERKANVR